MGITCYIYKYDCQSLSFTYIDIRVGDLTANPHPLLSAFLECCCCVRCSSWPFFLMSSACCSRHLVLGLSSDNLFKLVIFVII